MRQYIHWHSFLMLGTLMYITYVSKWCSKCSSCPPSTSRDMSSKRPPPSFMTCQRSTGKREPVLAWPQILKCWFLIPTLLNISILLHSGLNPALHFWLSTRFSCCLMMKSVENILGYIREQFYRFSRGCKPRENLWNRSRKYTKMFETDSFLGNKKLSLNQNVWRDH